MTNLVSDVVRVGRQVPRLCNFPLFVSTAGDEAVDLMDSLGKPMDEWQQIGIRNILGEKPDGRWAATRTGLLVARQNGKGVILEARELAGCVLFGEKLILHSAHEFKTCAEAFLRVKELIEANDWLARRVLKLRTSHGEEAVEWRNGARLRFVARSRSSGRGFTGQVNIMDEAQELPEVAITAMMPTLSAQPNPQILFTGTVPEPENDSVVWTRLMRQGRKGGSNSLGWIEWTPGERLDDLDNVDAWYDGNPALGIRITEEFIAIERETMSDRGFARERLSLWDSEDNAETVIPMDIWDASADADYIPQGKVVLAVDMPPGRRSAVIAAMSLRSDNRWDAEIIEQHKGSNWVAIRLAEIQNRRPEVAGVVIDPASPAGALIPDIEAEGVKVTTVTSREHAQACGALYDKVTQNGLTHRGDPILRDALKVGVKRPGPEGTWLWNRRESGDDISPIVAVTLAGYGLSTLVVEDPDVWGFWS